MNSGNVKYDGKNYVITLPDEVLTLDKQDILVSYTAKNNRPVLSDENVVVCLDLTITEELKQEGVARELVRSIQDARKQLDLEITNRIKLCLEGNYPKDFLEYICKETLSDYVQLDSADMQFEVEDIIVKIKK